MSGAEFIIPALSGIGTLLGGAASLIAGSRSRSEAPPVQLPAPEPPAAMPTPGDDAARKAAQRQQQAIRQRSGRASTMLSEFAKEKLG